MKHKLVDDVEVNVKVDLPTQDLEDLIETVATQAIQDLEDLIETVATQAIIVIGFYMLGDSARHILKAVIK